jgi:nitroimidazol reductase NimA-like FMN-containing flavoprotein (pyridoxamine 5'-phosphate oxidase superfamily)
MPDIKKILQKKLKKVRIMQLATAINNRPWACNVHFYSDDDLNFYWSSTPERRHSKEIKQNPNVAIAVKIHEDTPNEQYVICIAAEGKAELLPDSEVKKIGKQYFSKLTKDDSFLKEILTGKSSFKFYRFKPTRIVLFDTKNFPDDPRQEYSL